MSSRVWTLPICKVQAGTLGTQRLALRIIEFVKNLRLMITVPLYYYKDLVVY